MLSEWRIVAAVLGLILALLCLFGSITYDALAYSLGAEQGILCLSPFRGWMIGFSILAVLAACGISIFFLARNPRQ